MSSTPASAPFGRLTPAEVVARIRAALPAGNGPVALHEPRFVASEKKYLIDCIDTGWVSYGGAYVGRFESALAEACGTGTAIAVSSGTVALQVALWAAGIGSGDEVLVPALTFVASANAVVHAGAVPHFVDVDETTLGIAPAALAAHLEHIGTMRDGVLINTATGRPIRGLLPVHIFGHPVDMDPLDEVACRYGLIVVEDATEALGSRYKGRPCGSLAPLATLSFNGNKLVTTGGGGAILTGDNVLADRIRSITTTAKRKHPWAFIHDEVAWNFRMPNVNAAIGLGQMESLATGLAAKRRLWQRYREVFRDLPGLSIMQEASFATSNYWLVAFMLERGMEHMLEPILEATNAAGLMTRPAWTPMHLLPMYAANPRAQLPVTESLAQRILNVPSSPFLAPP